MALPFIVHLFPPQNGTPLGAILLPAFIAPLIAAYLFHPVAALLASLVTPALNRLITGQPTAEVTTLLTVELFAFALAAVLLVRRRPGLVLNALIAYAIAKLVATSVLAVTTIIPPPPLAYLTDSVTTGWPGIVILVIVNILLVTLWPRHTAGRGSGATGAR